MAPIVVSTRYQGLTCDERGVRWPAVPGGRAAGGHPWGDVSQVVPELAGASWFGHRGESLEHVRLGQAERRRLEEAWRERLAEELRREGGLERPRVRRSEALRLRGQLAGHLIALGVLAATVDWDLPSLAYLSANELFALALVPLGALFFFCLAWVYALGRDATSRTTAIRLDRRGCHFRDRSGSWSLRLSGERDSSRAPRHWRQRGVWLELAREPWGLAGLPERLLIGWAARAGCGEQLAERWDESRTLRRWARSFRLVWAPLLPLLAIGWLRLAKAPETETWTAATVIFAVLLALALACRWAAAHVSPSWAEREREGLALLERLGW